MKPYPKIETAFERRDDFKVDVTKIKSRAIANVKLWDATEKLDGTNVRIIYRPPAATAALGFPNEYGNMDVRGRSDRANLHGDLVSYITDTLTPADLFAYFVEQWEFDGEVATLYGEGVGPGIQKDGARYGDHKHFVLFDVKLNDGLAGWLDDDGVDEAAKGLGLIRCPRYTYGGRGDRPIEFDHAVGMVRHGLPSLYGEGDAEGLILRPHAEPLYDRRGHRVIAKIKTCDF